MHEVDERPSERLLDGVLRQRGPGRVQERPAPIGVNLEDDLSDALDHAAILGLARPERRFDGVASADVPGEGQQGLGDAPRGDEADEQRDGEGTQGPESGLPEWGVKRRWRGSGQRSNLAEQQREPDAQRNQARPVLPCWTDTEMVAVHGSAGVVGIATVASLER